MFINQNWNDLETLKIILTPKLIVFLYFMKNLNFHCFVHIFYLNPPKSILNPPVSAADTAASFWKVSI